LNSINSYFQDANPSPPFFWQEWRYKIGDPILFNESKRFPMLYNNLKGRIVDIHQGDDYICFTIDIDVLLTSLDSRRSNFEWISATDNTTRIRFTVYDNDGGTTDEERELARMNSIVPFQLAYAVSIHKAQGLEYSSIKVIIPNSNSERISHGIFYTAITRTKDKLKIYWSADTMKKIISSFYATEAETRSLELIKRKLQEERHV
jgi:ATP-dependent exoDNAse (exonuclease V) alpha subunit